MTLDPEDRFGDALLEAADAASAVGGEAVQEKLLLALSAIGVEWWGDGKGCDGCDRVLSSEIMSAAGWQWSEAVDANGDPDVAICPFCCREAQAAHDSGVQE